MGTPFIMIFALIVGALILVGGLSYIYKLTTMAKDINAGKVVIDLKTKVQAYYYLEEGNSKKIKIPFPAQIKNVCFYDSEKDWAPMSLSGTVKTDFPPDFGTKISSYKKFFEAFTERNIFIFPNEKLKESSFVIPNLNLEGQSNNPICVRNGREVKILSKGDHVEIEYIPIPT